MMLAQRNALLSAGILRGVVQVFFVIGAARPIQGVGQGDELHVLIPFKRTLCFYCILPVRQLVEM